VIIVESEVVRAANWLSERRLAVTPSLSVIPEESL